MKNVGTADRVARLCFAALLAFLAFEGWGETVSYIVALYLALTAIVGRCLVYRALDVNTCDHGGTYHSGEDPYDGRAGN